MTGAGDVRAENRNQELTAISRQLKQLARELNVPALALAQLNRGPEQTSDRRPSLHDLRDCGALEQDADVVLFLWQGKQESLDKATTTIVNVEFGKNRNGPVARGTFTFSIASARLSRAAKPEWSRRHRRHACRAGTGHRGVSSLTLSLSGGCSAVRVTRPP